MINVVDTFIPQCHEFLGKVFVKIPWQVLVRPDDENMVKVISSLLHIATKLSSEPQVRQVITVVQALSSYFKSDECSVTSLNFFGTFSVVS